MTERYQPANSNRCNSMYIVPDQVPEHVDYAINSLFHNTFKSNDSKICIVLLPIRKIYRQGPFKNQTIFFCNYRIPPTLPKALHIISERFRT